jgi:hypothetical protein
MATQRNPYTGENDDYNPDDLTYGDTPPVDAWHPDAPSGPPTDPSQYNDYAVQNPSFNPRDAVAKDAMPSAKSQISAAGLDGLNDPTILDDINRNISYAGQDGKDPQDMINRIIEKNKLRLDNAPGSTYHADGAGGYLTSPVKAGTPGNGPGSSQRIDNGAVTQGNSGSGPAAMPDIMQVLSGLFPNGAFNQDLVNRNVSNAADSLARNRKSQTSQNEAYLASRGLIGDGPQASAAGSLEDRLNQNYNSEVNSIYGNESQNASNRMMQALQMATGLTEDQAHNLIASFEANTARDLGFGNLALGNKVADNNYGLGMGNLALGHMNGVNNYNLGEDNIGLQRDQLKQKGDNDRLGRIIELLNSGVSLDQILAGGYI